MRIGIFGGTFNPPHAGHLKIAGFALNEANLSKVIFVPCGNPPHKNSSSVEIADAYHRLNMVKLAVKSNPSFEVSDIEVRSSDPSYTAKLLENFEQLYPGDRLCFIVGADSLRQMESWYHPELIFNRAEIIVALRGGYDNSDIPLIKKDFEKKYNAVISLLTMPEMEISSSSVRAMLKNGENTENMLCSLVFKYINENNIYGV